MIKPKCLSSHIDAGQRPLPCDTAEPASNQYSNPLHPPAPQCAAANTSIHHSVLRESASINEVQATAERFGAGKAFQKLS